MLNSNKYKICFIGGGLNSGGQERALTGLANYYSEKGFQVSIVNLFRTEQFFELNEKISVVWPSADRAKNHRLIYAMKIIPYLRKAIRQANPDVVLSFGEWFNPFVILSTRFLGIRLFVFDRMGPGISLGKLVGNARKILYRYADGIVVQTQAAARIVAQQTNARNIKIVPNPVNVINAGVKEKKRMIVSVGRLSKEKGHIVLIRAFAKLQQNDWTLHLIGDGPERPTLEKECLALGIPGKVVFHGFLKDFRHVLGESEIFVLPSFYEGFPNALLEAMSVPLACISSDCVAGPGDIINNGLNGMLVEPGNPDALASAMSMLIQNPDLRAALASEAYKARETYAFEKIAMQYTGFIFG